MFPRYHQDMRGCLWIHIPESQHMLVFQHDIRLYLARHHLAKQTITHRYVSSIDPLLCTIYTTMTHRCHPRKIVRGLTAGLIVFLLSITTGHAQELPLWEVGIGAGVLHLPLYRGVDQNRNFAIPFPIIIYRGNRFSIDEEGAHGYLFRSQDVRLELSLAGGVPVASNSDSPRVNMPDLDPTVELGPSMEIRLWHDSNRQRSLWLNLPLRTAISVSLDKLGLQGVTFSPYVEYIVESAEPDKWKAGLAWGPLFADNTYHDYFYAVDSAYVTPSRPEYHASSGYSGNRVTLTLQKKNGDLWLGAFVRYDDLNHAVFTDSPLVNSHNYLAIGAGFTYIFSKSDTLVERRDSVLSPSI